MEDNGWDPTAPLKWGFFFYSRKEIDLKGVFSELEGHEYKMEGLRNIDDKQWLLHVSKRDVLTPDKLYSRNVAFNELAEAYHSYYDGWDVAKDVE